MKEGELIANAARAAWWDFDIPSWANDKSQRYGNAEDRRQWRITPSS